MYSFLFRQKALNVTFEIEDIKQALIAIALSHPKVSITLRNESSGDKLMQFNPTNSIEKAFVNIFKSAGLCQTELISIEASSIQNLTLSGFITRQRFSNPSKQFFFVNNRFVKRSRLLKLISKLVRECNIDIKNGDSIEKQSPTKIKHCYNGFVLYLKCSIKDVDFTFEPRKSEVEFVHRKQVETFVLDSIKSCLMRSCHGLENKVSIFRNNWFFYLLYKKAVHSGRKVSADVDLFPKYSAIKSRPI